MTRFAVILISPPGFPHAQALADVADAVAFGLEALGADVLRGGDPDVHGARSIVLGAHLLDDPSALPSDAVIYNLEQLSAASVWMTAAYRAALRTHMVWDYSPRNLAVLTGLGAPAAHLMPIGHASGLERVPQGPKDIDVLFYGAPHPRRQAVLQALAARGVKVVAAVGVYGGARDALISRARIVLNLHYYDPPQFEVVRVSYLLSNGVCVVSEGGDPEAEAPFARAVAFAPYAAVVETCLALLGDPPRQDQLAAAGQALMRARPQADFLRAALDPGEEAGVAALRTPWGWAKD